LTALDAYRGFIMIALAAGGFGFVALENHPVWGVVARQFDHVAWEGGVFWDMIQPAFMFMVGVAMPFAIARRMELGATFGQNVKHVLSRAIRLLALSQILISVSDGKLEFQLINVLAQIAFTYLLCFFIMQMEWRWQAVTAALLLAGHWALFALFPGPDGSFSKDHNVGDAIDRWLLGRNYSGHYVTINFIGSTVTTLAGVWAGNLLRSNRSHAAKLKILAMGMAAAFAGGLALSIWNPLVKRIWTASFTLYSTGWVVFMLIGFYWLIEVKGYRKWAFPLVVVGMNSIFIYSVGQVLKGWIDRAVAVFTFRYTFIGDLAPVAQACTVLLVMWYMCYWLYQRKILFKL
jgi:heparan-alpha-glucosaminide N-acetyltransferase